MIRRQEGEHWCLIDQVNHAHLAAELASAWGNDKVAPLPLPELLIPAIRHHDDGWKEWSAAPQIDPATGRPRNFTEMEMAVSTDLWRKSIEVCAVQAPLAAIWVSKHFCHLAEKARESRQDNDADVQAIEQFLSDQTGAQQQWMKKESKRSRELQAIDADWLDSAVELGVQYVQFFDALSLWLCCTPYIEMQPLKTSLPNGEVVLWTPREFDAPRGTVIAAQPYPFAERSKLLGAFARRVPARRYASDEELHETMQSSPSGHLRWSFVTVPAGWSMSADQ